MRAAVSALPHHLSPSCFARAPRHHDRLCGQAPAIQPACQSPNESPASLNNASEIPGLFLQQYLDTPPCIHRPVTPPHPPRIRQESPKDLPSIPQRSHACTPHATSYACTMNLTVNCSSYATPIMSHMHPPYACLTCLLMHPRSYAP